MTDSKNRQNLFDSFTININTHILSAKFRHTTNLLNDQNFNNYGQILAIKVANLQTVIVRF